MNIYLIEAIKTDGWFPGPYKIVVSAPNEAEAKYMAYHCYENFMKHPIKIIQIHDDVPKIILVASVY